MRRRVIFAIICLIALGAGTAFAENTHILTGGEYFQTAERLIQGAKESIYVAMYSINVGPAPDANPASILLEDLITARKRNVKVKVILDKSMYTSNYNAYKRLQRAGVDVYFNTRRAILHGKAIVIDSVACILGSNNWSRSSLYDNYEFSVLMEDPLQSAKMLDYISKIELDHQPPVQPLDMAGVRLPVALLTSPDKPCLSRLLTVSSDRCFDLYLYIAKKMRDSNSKVLKIDYKEFGRDLGYTRNYFFNIASLLRRLRSKYGLIQLKPWSRRVELVDLPSEQYFIIPDAYWDYGFDKKLVQQEKYLYLIALCESQTSGQNPYWFRSAADMSQKYHIGVRTITAGMTALERENIVEVYRHKPNTEGDFTDRLANEYRLNPLRSQGQFEQALKALSEKYSLDEVKQACALSARLNEPKDLEKIETYIGLIRTYGLEKVKGVNDEVALRHLHSGFQDIEQVILLLKQK